MMVMTGKAFLRSINRGVSFMQTGLGALVLFLQPSRVGNSFADAKPSFFPLLFFWGIKGVKSLFCLTKPFFSKRNPGRIVSYPGRARHLFSFPHTFFLQRTFDMPSDNIRFF